MVYLSRIYTKGGDRGDTSLGDGVRVPKDHPRVAAYGDVDELNATLGLMLLQPGIDADLRTLIQGIQNDLFDVGADLCVPESPGVQGLRVKAEQGLRLEKAIDHYNEHLEPLQSFILPGGSSASSWCHLARTVCRRAERSVVTLSHSEKVNGEVIIYLNRLSDLLFVLGRVLNDGGKADVLWVPGQGMKSP